MKFLTDRVVERLRQVSDYPDLSGTKYRLGPLLGRGGMATVYQVEDRELGRAVALKVLSDPDPSPDLSERLLREARHLARLEHPNIVPIHDVGRLPDGRVFYVMKFIRGQRLDHWQRQVRSRPAMLRMFGKICDAVAFAHAHGVVHRDLKPENVMVGEFGEAVIMDWGVAKVMREPAAAEVETVVRGGGMGEREAGSGEEGTAHGTILGTPGYMAPEQARGETDRVDERTDVYALGAVLHFLMSGRPPEAGTVAGAGAASWAAPAPLRRLDPRIPRPLESICRMAMQERPEDRYGSAAELAADVESFADGGPVRAHPESPLERGRRYLRKYLVFVLLILTYLVTRILVLYFTGR